MNASFYYAREQGEGVRGYTGARERGKEVGRGRRAQPDRIYAKIGGSLRWVLRTPTRNFIGLAAPWKGKRRVKGEGAMGIS
jgi:hypothetical protein